MDDAAGQTMNDNGGRRTRHREHPRMDGVTEDTKSSDIS